MTLFKISDTALEVFEHKKLQKLLEMDSRTILEPQNRSKDMKIHFFRTKTTQISTKNDIFETAEHEPGDFSLPRL